MNRKKTLILAVCMLVVLLFMALTPTLLKPVAKRDPPPVALDTRGQKEISFLSEDRYFSNRMRPDLPTSKSSEHYLNDSETEQTRSIAQQKSLRTTKMSLLTRTEDSIADSENTHEVTHIEFLKVHKAASSTTQSIILRFGLKRNLSFVIPTPSLYFSRHKYFFSDYWPTLPEKPNVRQRARLSVGENIKCNRKYDILSHHMVFNHKKVSQLLHNDTVYVAIVREPFDLFVSAAFYYKFTFKYAYLHKLSNETFITDLIRNPKQNEATSMAESMTYNSMSYDFGMNFLSMRTADEITEEEIVEFLKKTGDTFHLVMVAEKFDESLVLLKRYLNWSLQDVLYTKINTFTVPSDTSITSGNFGVTADDMKVFRKRNKFDYRLYNFFKDRLEQQISKEELFTEEVEHFKIILRDVQKFCSSLETEKMKAKDFTEKQNNDSSNVKQNEEIKGNNSKPENNARSRNKKLLKSINLIKSTKEVSKRQEEELYELLTLIDRNSLPTTTMHISKLLPLLFRDKVTQTPSESKLLVPNSKWNKKFYVTSRDCDFMTKDIVSLYEVVKQNHLQILIENKLGNDFSVVGAVKYISTFT